MDNFETYLRGLRTLLNNIEAQYRRRDFDMMVDETYDAGELIAHIQSMAEYLKKQQEAHNSIL